MKLSKLTFGQYTYLLIVVTATIRAFMKFGTYYYFKMFYLPPTSNLKKNLHFIIYLLSYFKCNFKRNLLYYKFTLIFYFTAAVFWVHLKTIHRTLRPHHYSLQLSRPCLTAWNLNRDSNLEIWQKLFELQKHIMKFIWGQIITLQNTVNGFIFK